MLVFHKFVVLQNKKYNDYVEHLTMFSHIKQYNFSEFDLMYTITEYVN